MGDFYYWCPPSKIGLPSFDIDSLQVLTYIKLAGADVSLHPTMKSWFTNEGKVLLCLRTSNGVHLDKPDDIIKHLMELGFDLDAKLDADSANNILPFSTLIKEKLLPAVLHAIWMDDANYSEVTHQMYAKACRFPVNFVTPVHMRKTQENFVKEFKFLKDNDEMAVAQLMTSAQSMLNLLSEYLSENDYILGEHPTSLDALLISILAPLLKMNVTSCKLQNHLNGCVSICQYINRVLKENFKDELQQNLPSTPARAAQCSSDPEAVDWKYDVILPVAVAGIAMFSYAVNASLILR